MDVLNFRDVVIGSDVLSPVFWRECTPRILVITDGLNFDPNQGFGLTQFVNTLKGNSIHGMTPIVKTALRRVVPRNPITGVPTEALPDFEDFNLADPVSGIAIGRYDVVFMLGINREGQRQLSAPEVTAVARFMQAGGGVFATGDHEDLGAAQGLDIPRVNKMRFWKLADTPNVGNTTRLSTNLPGSNDVFEFEDQSDPFAQRLYPNYRTGVTFLELILAGSKVRRPHPLLQIGATGCVDSFPDHPHEGECRVPTDLTTSFMLDGAAVEEWPAAIGRPIFGGGARFAPEPVAMTMSYGNGFDVGPTGPKDALAPRAFMPICAYNGHRANIGRVVTDATWHHFVNVNIDGKGSSRAGLQDPPGTDTAALAEIRQYYRNLATWLMPKNVRMCLRFPLIIKELVRYPLFEELRLPPLKLAQPEDLRHIGEALVNSLQTRLPTFEVQELVADALEEAGIDRALEELSQVDHRVVQDMISGAAHAALGALTIATVERFAEIRGKEKVDVHAAFDKLGQEAARLGAGAYLNHERKRIRQLDACMEKLAA